MKLSEKIYICRKKAGLSQDALAEKLEVSRQAVSKWENGEAVPETGKLPGLAKAFGVTIDWLLSEEEPVDEEVRNGPFAEEERCGNTETQASSPEWLDRLPGILVKLVRMWGWLAGVYVAIGGAGIAGIGALAKYIVWKMVSMNSMSSPFGGGFGEIMITDQFGNPVDGEVAEIIMGELAPSVGYSGMDGFGQELLTGNPVNILANVMIVIGLALLIGGIVLAVWLYRRREEK